ncbi:MAG: aminotransferase class V-fold PLP-dependent enzyme [Lachnospiraceae bacterium]|nr:aminotransferase class V-fold PLP-dependent enzyme [Lachnospiraceae bacterium]
MYSFNNDYSEGAYPGILEKLMETNLIQTVGYGLDEYCKEAEKIILKHIEKEDSHVHFISGGTQANLLAISSFIKPYEAVITVTTGHINVHETGSIEGTGHKILTKYASDGKVTPEIIDALMEENTTEHMVKPALIYISDSTEVGTIYTKSELEELRHSADKHGLILFMDGARLGAALTADANDLTMADIAALTDAFYIGGTKNGALFGEALVINNERLNEDFRYMEKQKGAMLAKGRMLGIQFMELFKDNVFYDLAAHANKCAAIIKDALLDKDIEFKYEPESNQLFPIFTYKDIDKLSKDYLFSIDSKVDEEHACVRIVTSWATKESAVEEFVKAIKEL